MDTVQGSTFALQAMSEKYTGIPYSQMDCQAFVEQVLKDCGVRNTDRKAYNWRGSNHMWRDALAWKGTIQECLTRYGEIPCGAWVFIVRNDGGEKERGYDDNEGNATHVGIYCHSGLDPVRDSTRTAKRDGVGYRDISSFTHVGLPYMIIYNEDNLPIDYTDPVQAVGVIRNSMATDEQYLKALETLTKYMRGV